jgi:hypothetical protein
MAEGTPGHAGADLSALRPLPTTSAPCSQSFTTRCRSGSEMAEPGRSPCRRGGRRRSLGPRPERRPSVLCSLPSDLWPLTPGSTWWSQRGGPTRPHSELGRETPPRPGYCPTKGWESGSPPGRARSPSSEVRRQTTDLDCRARMLDRSLRPRAGPASGQPLTCRPRASRLASPPMRSRPAQLGLSSDP